MDDAGESSLGGRKFGFVQFGSQFACFESNCYQLISDKFHIVGHADPTVATVANISHAHASCLPVMYRPEEVHYMYINGFAEVFEVVFPDQDGYDDAISLETRGDEALFKVDDKMIKDAGNIVRGRKRKKMYLEMGNVPKQKRPKILDSEIEIEEEELEEAVREILATRRTWIRTPLISDADRLKPMNGSIFPQTKEHSQRLTLLTDLLGRGYFLTDGTKFGCHYLVYDGKPGEFHSSYMCTMFDSQEQLTFEWSRLHGRLARSVKKELLIAVIAGKTVTYIKQSLWNGTATGQGIAKKSKSTFEMVQQITAEKIRKNATSWEDWVV